MKKIIIIIFIVFILFASLYLTNTIIRNGGNIMNYNVSLKKLMNKKKEQNKLLEISYSNSGNSLGNLEKHTIDIDNLILTTEIAEMHSIPIEVTEYTITKEDIEYLTDIIEKYNLPAWSTLEIDTDHIALDAPTKTITLTYDNSKEGGYKKWYSISYDMKLPKEGYDILNNFKSYIISKETEENIIKSYKKEVA